MSGPTAGTVRRDPEAILREAAALAREFGDAFTMEQLERRTGLSRATLYRRVGSKRAVLKRLAATGDAAAAERPSSRARILAAARRVVAARGVAGATMERVAEEAGVGVATVYRRFGGREHLLDAFVHATEGRARVRDTLEHADGDLRADLTAVARAALMLFTDNRDLMRIVIGGTREELDVLRVLKGSSERTLDRLASLFAREAEAGRLTRAGTPRRLALAFVGMLLAFAVIGPEHYGVRTDDPAALARLAVHVFLDGAAT
jgi:AcrR family transcriptional regulator